MFVSIEVSIAFIHGDSIVGLRGFLIGVLEVIAYSFEWGVKLSDNMVLASLNTGFNENLSLLISNGGMSVRLCELEFSVKRWQTV